MQAISCRVLTKVAGELDKESRLGPQGWPLEHHGGCYQIDLIQKHIAVNQRSEAAVITAGAINCLSTKEAGGKNARMWLRGKKPQTHFCFLWLAVKHQKGYEKWPLLQLNAFYMEYSASHCSQNHSCEEVLVSMKATGKKVNGGWESQSMVFTWVLVYLSYTYDI